jgi:hypothetical protein
MLEDGGGFLLGNRRRRAGLTQNALDRRMITSNPGNWLPMGAWMVDFVLRIGAHESFLVLPL